MPRLPNKTWATIRTRWEAGEAQAALSREFDVSEQTIRGHRDSEGWTRDGQANEPVTEPSAPAVVDLIEAPDPRDQKIAELESELSRYKPANVEWALDEKAAATQLADQLEDRIRVVLWEEINSERKRRDEPIFTLEEMKRARPEWYEQQKDRIIRSVVADLTRWATAEGQATRTLAMIKADGTVVQVPLDEGIDNFGLSPVQFIQRKKARGYRVTKQVKCLRQDCWVPPKRQYEMRGFDELLGIQGEVPFLGYCEELHYSLDPLAVEGKLPFGEVTTATTTASFDR